MRPELVRYYHEGHTHDHYQSWLGLTVALVARHFPVSDETWRHHGRKIQANLQPTKKAIEEEMAETKAVEKILREPGGQDKGADLTGCVYHKVYNLQDNSDRNMYTDQTGRFPIWSYRGMQHVMVLIELESNSILVAGMRNCTSGEMVKAYQIRIDFFGLYYYMGLIERVTSAYLY